MSHAIKLAQEHSARQPILEGRTFIDIGANIGTTTIPALMTFDAQSAIVFEPETDNYKLLRCNLIANDLDSRVTTIQLALSDHKGSGVLEHDGAGGDHRVRTTAGLPDGTYRESLRPTIAVQLGRFDDFVDEIPIDLGKVGLVWMDTQGHEGHVLAGAQMLLETDIPVVIEYWPYGLRRADGLGLIHELISGHYKRVIDVRASMKMQTVVDLPAADVSILAQRYGGTTYTDLLLLS